ncbi:GNAT family N-acetyltransferase [Pseudoxanthomonas composti]|uniref:GNAT family N-acetyltransferase n=1 Tax=Pseudoxanthomonas composti TaxID=2137479 RepID=A0A4Q1JXL7_9GAMM|nr:GNAT family N-acetyltransferase [Pseudoxanthomonas composti]RXR07040.1 GNAT family N-acetyltransferase [Pseudoxanthomonas composti]
MPLPDSLRLRPAVEADIPALFALRKQTMEAHMRASGAQTSDDYHMAKLRKGYELAQVLEEEGRIVGLFKVDRGHDPWKVIQIHLAPALQGRGIGKALISDFIQEARQAGCDVTLNVLTQNPARALYERLGFVVTGEEGSEYVMLLRQR